MNPEPPNNPREELELRITALLLGELSADEAAAVREAIAKDAELTKLHDDLKQTIVLVREASSMKETAAPQTEALQLSEERRQKLLTAFKIPPLKEEHRKPWRLFQFTLLEAMAVIAVLGLLAAVLLPNFIKARTTSQRNNVVNNLRQLDGAKQQWALEKNKPADAQPTCADIHPYMGRSAGDFPSAVAGEKYVLGKVGEPPSAVMEVDRSRSWFGALGPESKSTARVTLPQDADSDTRGRTYASSRKSRENQTITASVPIDVENGFYAGVKAVPPPALPASAPIPGSLAPAVQSSVKIELPTLATAESDPANSPALQLLPEPEVRQSIVNGLSSGNSEGGVGDNKMGGRVPVLGDLPTLGKQFERAGRGDSGLKGGINGVAKSQSKGAVALVEESLGAVALDESIRTTPASEPASVLGIPAPQDSSQALAYSITGATKDKEGKASDSYRIKAGIEARKETADNSKRATSKTSKNWSIATNSIGGPVARYYSDTEREQLARKGDAELTIADGPKNLGEAVRQSVAVDALGVLPAEQNAPTDAKSADSLRSEETRPYFEAKKKMEELKRTLVESQSDPAPPRKPATNVAIPQPEIQTSENNFSTFSLNVSDVSFKLAAASLEKGQMPDAASVRSEEFINAFDYRDPEAKGGAPIAFAWERARYPFAHNRDLLRLSLKTAAAGRQAGRPLNIVLLLDNSGSMERADRVLIRREALRVLSSQLQSQDKLSVITFARTARLVVGGVAGDKAGEVLDQVSSLTPEGGTNLEEAMNLAYQIAAKHYLASGINRVVLLTDGAANLGDVEPASLKQKVEAQRKQGIALDCFGIGWEGFNDDLLEVLSRNGDGRYGFLNSPEEAATDFAGQLAGALKVAASDVKVQVEFNPKRVTSYRQIGYAKHQLTKEQFRDNTVDAAEIAAQEAGNALYTVESNPAGEGPLATVRVRYKVPGTTDYREQSWDVPFTGNALSLEQSSPAMRLAASASAFSEWLVASPFAGEVKLDALLGYLRGVPEVYGADARPKKLEWMIRQAKSVAGQ